MLFSTRFFRIRLTRRLSVWISRGVAGSPSPRRRSTFFWRAKRTDGGFARLQQFGGFDQRQRRLEIGAFDARQVQQIAQHLFEPAEMAVDHANAAVRIAAGSSPIDLAQRLKGDLDGGDGRAQFVAGVGDEIGLHLDRAGEGADIAQNQQRPAAGGAGGDGLIGAVAARCAPGGSRD